MEFDWDEDNEDHIAENRVLPEEVEGVFFNNPVPWQNETRKGEKRHAIIGQTDAGRYLVVVYTIRYRMIRTVTAYEAEEKHKRLYHKRRR